MDVDHDENAEAGPSVEVPEEAEEIHPEQLVQTKHATSGVIPGSIRRAKEAARADLQRTRSPTPPRALYRSTTGKGVAFTEPDVTFLVRFLEYRARQQEGKMDMVAFWKDVASKVCMRHLIVSLTLTCYRLLIIREHHG